MTVQDNEPDNMPQGQEERKELIQCLALAYGVTPQDSEGYYFNYGRLTQKEIASQLGYDNSTLGKMLKPDWINAHNRSYKPLIACLKKQIEINGLKEKKKPGMRLWVFVASLTLLFLSNAFWFLNRNEEPITADTIEKHFLKTEGDFAAFFSAGSGPTVANLVAKEFYERVRDLRDSVKAGHTLTRSQKQDMLIRFLYVARKSDGEVRHEMSNLGYFVAYKKYNVVDIIDHITPRATLFKCQPEDFLLDSIPDCAKRSDAHFDKALWNRRDFLFRLDMPEEDYKKGIVEAIRAVQQELSTEDMNVFKHFVETGELKKPDYEN